MRGDRAPGRAKNGAGALALGADFVVAMIEGLGSAWRESLGAWIYGNPLYNASLARRAPDRLRFVPPAPWPGDAERGAALVRGRLALEDTALLLDPPDWLPENASPAALAALHGFDWLADLRAQGGDPARRQARALVGSWLDRFDEWHPVAWRGDLLGRRVYNWLVAHDFFCSSADAEFRERCLGALARQARHLARTLPGGGAGIGHLGALKALAVAGLAFEGQEAWVERGVKLLLRELDRQVLADGGHAARSPHAQLALARHLIELRAALRAAGREPLPALDRAIDTAALMLRMLRHGDGRLALFNGGREETRAAVEQVLAQARPNMRPPAAAPDWGYDRLVAGRTLVIVDTGRPAAAPFAAEAHAGALSFEMSVGRDRLIVNAGARPGIGEPWATAQRATAAHSTLVVDDTNSVELLPDGFGRIPVRFERGRREQDGSHWLDAQHDGYRPAFGLMHRRRLFLAAGGEDLRGEDTLTRIGSGAGVATGFVVRFHLHPEVRVSLAQNSASVLLGLPGGVGFRLKARGAEIAVAAGVYLGGEGAPRRSQQVVLSGAVEGAGAPGENAACVCWALQRV